MIGRHCRGGPGSKSNPTWIPSLRNRTASDQRLAGHEAKLHEAIMQFLMPSLSRALQATEHLDKDKDVVLVLPKFFPSNDAKLFSSVGLQVSISHICGTKNSKSLILARNMTIVKPLRETTSEQTDSRGASVKQYDLSLRASWCTRACQGWVMLLAASRSLTRG